jgi:hypothetical protein
VPKLNLAHINVNDNVYVYVNVNVKRIMYKCISLILIIIRNT